MNSKNQDEYFLKNSIKTENNCSFCQKKPQKNLAIKILETSFLCSKCFFNLQNGDR